MWHLRRQLSALSLSRSLLLRDALVASLQGCSAACSELPLQSAAQVPSTPALLGPLTYCASLPADIGRLLRAIMIAHTHWPLALSTVTTVAGSCNSQLATACAVGGDRQPAPRAIQPAAAACTAAQQPQTARLCPGACRATLLHAPSWQVHVSPALRPRHIR